MALKKISHKVDRTGRVRKARKKGKVNLIDLTSLIDILTILLVFLIKNVSMEVQKFKVPEKLALPMSYQNEKQMLETLLENGETIVVRFFKDQIYYGRNNVQVGSPEEFFNDKSIAAALLSLMKEEANVITKQGKEPAVLVQADKDILCMYITKFMLMSAEASFPNVFFSTIKAEGSPSYANAAR